MRHSIPLASYGLDRIRTKLPAQTSDEYLDGVGVSIEVLRIDVFDNLGTGDNLARSLQKELQQSEFKRSKFSPAPWRTCFYYAQKSMAVRVTRS